MHTRSKQNSQLNIQGYGQGQSRTKYYETQTQGYNDSPVRNRGPSKYGSNKKISQVASKIQDVINLCVNDRGQGNQQFEGIANAEKGILDLLMGSDLPEISVPIGNIPTSQSGGFAATVGGFGGENQKGSRPFIQMSATTPQNRNGHPSIRTQLANNPRAVVGDDALEMIQQIEKKALLQIENLKRDKSELVRRLNEQIRLHNDEKRRRVWCEDELKRLMNFLQQNGFRVGQIQYPEWYLQGSAPSQQQQQQTYTVGGSVQPGQSRYIQENQRPQSPQQYDHTGTIPSFAQQQQGLNTTQQYPPNPNQASQNTAFNNFNQSQLGQSVHNQRPSSSNPQQIQSTYQIAPSQGTYHQGFNTVTNAFNQTGNQNLDTSYHQRMPNYEDPTRNSQYRPQSPIQGYTVHPQTGQLIQLPDYNNIRSGIQQLRQENLYMKQNISGTEGLEDFQTLQQRLMAAEQRARAYQREMGRWKMEASRRVGGDYPGLAELLQQTQKIRRQTIKLLKLKETGRLGGVQRANYSEQENYQSRQENNEGRSRKVQKGSFQTNALSPKSDYQSMLQEMRRIAKN